MDSGASTRLRNGPHGYGLVTRTLHWATVGLLLAQLVVGYVMAAGEDGGGHGGGRGRGRGEGSGHGRERGGDDDFSHLQLLPVHVIVGILILVLAILRVLWRLSTPLPPWAESLSATERRVATATERTLLVLLFVIPATGLLLVLSGEDDYVGLHVAAHLAFFAALAAHVGLVLGHRVRTGESLLARMT